MSQQTNGIPFQNLGASNNSGSTQPGIAAPAQVQSNNQNHQIVVPRTSRWKVYRQACCTYLWTELKSVSKFSWLFMAVMGVLVIPWTYRSYRLAAWTAKLDYLQECRETLPMLTGKANEKCEIAIKTGLKPPPGVAIPKNVRAMQMFLASIDHFRSAEKTGMVLDRSLSPWLYCLAAVAAVVAAFALRQREPRYPRPWGMTFPRTAKVPTMRPLSNELFLNLALAATLAYFAAILPALTKKRWREAARYYDSCLNAKDQEEDLSPDCSFLLFNHTVISPSLPEVRLPDILPNHRNNSQTSNLPNATQITTRKSSQSSQFLEATFPISITSTEDSARVDLSTFTKLLTATSSTSQPFDDVQSCQHVIVNAGSHVSCADHLTNGNKDVVPTAHLTEPPVIITSSALSFSTILMVPQHFRSNVPMTTYAMTSASSVASPTANPYRQGFLIGLSISIGMAALTLLPAVIVLTTLLYGRLRGCIFRHRNRKYSKMYSWDQGESYSHAESRPALPSDLLPDDPVRVPRPVEIAHLGQRPELDSSRGKNFRSSQ